MNTNPNDKSAVASVADDQSFDLWSLVALAWKYKLLLILFAGIGLVGAYFYLNQAKPTFLASARILVERQGGELEKRAQLRYDPAFVQTQAEIVRSRVVMERSLEDFTPDSFSEGSEQIDPIRLASESLTVAAVEGTDVLQFAFRSSRSQDAVKMLETVIKNYSEFISETEKDTQLQSLEFLTKQEQEIRNELDLKKKEYRQLREKSALLGVGEETGRAQLEYLTNLGRTVTEVKGKRAKLESLTAAWTDQEVLVASVLPANPKEHQTFKIVTEPTKRENLDAFTVPMTETTNHSADLKRIEQELHLAREQVNKLSDQYGEKYPELKSSRQVVSGLESRREQILNSIRKSFQAELDAYKKQEQELEKLYQDELQRAKQLDVDRIEEQQFVDSIERLQSVHDSLMAEMNARQMASASAEQGQGLVVMKVIAAPQSSGNPIWPIPKVIYLLCTFAGTSLGFVLALGIDQLRFRRRQHAHFDNTSTGKVLHPANGIVTSQS